MGKLSNTAMESKFGLMEVHMWVNGLMAIKKVEESIPGVIRESMMDNGKRANFMEKEFRHGLMVESIEALTKMMLEAASESMNGQTVRNMKDNGRMETKKEKEFLLTRKVCLEKVISKTEKDCTGLEK